MFGFTPWIVSLVSNYTNYSLVLRRGISKAIGYDSNFYFIAPGSGAINNVSIQEKMFSSSISNNKLEWYLFRVVRITLKTNSNSFSIEDSASMQLNQNDTDYYYSAFG